MDLKKYIRSIPDYPKKGILFRDITTLIKDKNGFKNCVDQLANLIGKIRYDKIAAIESRGFIFASPLSYNLSKPNILLRKKNKFPADKYSVDFKLEYGEATLLNRSIVSLKASLFFIKVVISLNKIPFFG